MGLLITASTARCLFRSLQIKMNFFEKVYEVVRKIPQGKVATYGQIAEILGTKDSRKIGWALHANQDQETPCHRVVSRVGALAPNFAFEGEKEQRRRLEAEGVSFMGDRVDLEKNLWNPLG